MYMDMTYFISKVNAIELLVLNLLNEVTKSVLDRISWYGELGYTTYQFICADMSMLRNTAQIAMLSLCTLLIYAIRKFLSLVSLNVGGIGLSGPKY